MNIRFNRLLAILVVASFAMTTACKKKDTLVLPGLQAHFANSSSGNYFITGPTVTYKIPVGVTTVSSSDRTISVSVTSPTGAVSGTHYTLGKTSVVIPAGKAIDSIEVKGVFAQYQGGRKDTLLFTITTANGVGASDYNATFRLAMRGPCAETEINTELQALKGSYLNTNELFGTSAYGPYTTGITSLTRVGPTKADIVVTNIWDAGWNPITFTMDWTDLNNRTVTLIQQAGIGDAGTLNTAYTGMDVSVRPFAGNVGTYTFCTQKLTLKLQLGVTGLGWFGSLYTVNMSR